MVKTFQIEDIEISIQGEKLVPLSIDESTFTNVFNSEYVKYNRETGVFEPIQLDEEEENQFVLTWEI